MKTINRFTRILLACTVFCGVGFASSSDLFKDKDVEDPTVNFHQEYGHRWIRTSFPGKLCFKDLIGFEKSIHILEVPVYSEDTHYKYYFLCHSYSEGMRQPIYDALGRMVRKSFEDDKIDDIAAFVTTVTTDSFYDEQIKKSNLLIKEIKESIVPQVCVFMEKRLESRKNILLKNQDIRGFIELCHQYRVFNSTKADQWLSEIKTLATKEVEYHARASVRLASTEDLSMEEEKKALAIISSFPTSHSLRTHLQKCFDDMKQTTNPPTVREEAVTQLIKEILGMDK